MTEVEERTLGLPFGRSLTRAELQGLPDDWHRYELLDGMLIVTPPPSVPHQVVALNIIILLREQCTPDLRVLMAPVAVALDDDELQPDVLVAPKAQFTHRELVGAPLLTVEVLSPTTRRYDLSMKRSRYEEAGTASYWVVDPVALTLTAWELEDGAYVEVAHVSGDEEYATTHPFPVTIRPSDLLD